MPEGGGHYILIMFHTQEAAVFRKIFQKKLKAVPKKRGRDKNKSLSANLPAPRGCIRPAFGIPGMAERFVAAVQDGAFRGVYNP
jgi:hypothetical protein